MMFVVCESVVLCANVNKLLFEVSVSEIERERCGMDVHVLIYYQIAMPCNVFPCDDVKSKVPNQSFNHKIKSNSCVCWLVPLDERRGWCVVEIELSSTFHFFSFSSSVRFSPHTRMATANLFVHAKHTLPLTIRCCGVARILFSLVQSTLDFHLISSDCGTWLPSCCSISNWYVDDSHIAHRI